MSESTRPYYGGAAAVKAALLATRDLPKTERLVLVAIAAHTNARGDAWPSVSTIADYVGCSVRTVQRALAKLVQMGRLIVRKVAGVATRVYRIVVPGATDSASGATDSDAGGDSQGVTQSCEDHVKAKEARAHARDWRRFLPKSRRNPVVPASASPMPAERRGAALPPPRDVPRCTRPGHIGQPADRCAACRSEQLGVQ